MAKSTGSRLRLKCDIVVIGPRKAKRILDEHTNYRKFSKFRADCYSKLMTAGNWKLSVIAFDKEGTLVDGQTRLRAVIMSGIPQRFVALYGWPREDVIAIDDGQPRTKAQVAKAERGMLSGNIRLAIARGIEIGVTCERCYISNLQALEIYDKYKDVIEALMAVAQPPLTAAMHAIPYGRAIVQKPWKRTEVLNCWNALQTMDFSLSRAQGLKLYLRFVTSQLRGNLGAVTRRELYLKGARALQAWLNNETLSRLALPAKDPFDLGNKKPLKPKK